MHALAHWQEINWYDAHSQFLLIESKENPHDSSFAIKGSSVAILENARKVGKSEKRKENWCLLSFAITTKVRLWRCYKGK